MSAQALTPVAVQAPEPNEELKNILQFVLAKLDENSQKTEANMKKTEANMQKMEANMEANMQKMEANMQKIEANMQKMEAKMEANMQKTEANMQKIEANMQKMEANMQQQFTDVSSQLVSIKKEISAVSSRLGFVCEHAVRESIAKEYNARFAKGFEVANLVGLARLASPKLLSPDSIKQQEKMARKLADHLDMKVMQSKLHAIVTKQLGEFNLPSTSDFVADTFSLVKHLNGLVTASKDEQETKRKYRHLLNLKSIAEQQANFDKGDAQTRKNILIYSNIGLMAFAVGTLSDNELPTAYSFEIDCRGDVMLSQNQTLVRMGEIKVSTSAGRKGTEQLLMRLSLVNKTAKILHDKQVESQGFVFIAEHGIFTKLNTEPVVYNLHNRPSVLASVEGTITIFKKHVS